MARRKTPKVPTTPSAIRRELERLEVTPDHHVRAIVGSLLLLADRFEAWAMALDTVLFEREHRRHGEALRVSCFDCGMIWDGSELGPRRTKKTASGVALAYWDCPGKDCEGKCAPIASNAIPKGPA